MADVQKYLSTSLQKLETVQAEVGDVQFQLYEALADDLLLASTEEGIRTAVVDMEDVQRIVGMIQVNLLKALVEIKKTVRDAAATKVPAAPPSPSVIPPVSPVPSQARPPSPLVPALPPTATTAQPESAVVQPAPHAEEWDVAEWLKSRGLDVQGISQETPLDQGADEVALFLGDNYEALKDLLRVLRSQVDGGTAHACKLNGRNEAAAIALRAWGKLLHNKVFLKKYYEDFHYGRLVAEIQPDPRIYRFFNGEWLERYVTSVAKIESQVLGLPKLTSFRGVTVKNQAQGDAELDLLAGCGADRVMWLECKSGEWRGYLQRYKWLNEDHLHLSPSQAALVIAEIVDDNQAAVARALCGMSVLNVKDLRGWMRQAMQGW